MATATRLLNAAAIPFALKVLDHAAAFRRCDTAVLYLTTGDFRRGREPLRTIASAVGPWLRDAAPAFTKPLAPGVAVAEHDRGLGASFGTTRCGLVAEGVVGAHERGATSISERLDAIADRFADAGLDLDAPYLRPAGADAYAL
jgi:hypothetical protein